MDRTRSALIALLVALVGCSSRPPVEDDLVLGSAATDAQEEAQEEKLREITVEAPVDSLASMEIPELPAKEAEEERERVLAQTEPTFDLPVELNATVLGCIENYTTKNAGWYARALARSGRVMDMIHATFREEGIPTDLAALGMVESAYRYNARSRVGAIGMWQFMRGTAQRYGLMCNRVIDERLNPEKSTRAAARYLRDLYAEFGDWYLAMAAYNSGEGTVRSAIRRSGSRDFWHLARNGYLPKETRNFVPAILACAVIAKTPERFGITDVAYEAPYQFEEVRVPGGTHLDVVARCAQVTSSEVRLLNPELIGLRAPKGVGDYPVRVPVGTGEGLLAGLGRLSAAERQLVADVGRHRVKKGETLGLLATRYGTTVRTLQSLNKMGKKSTIRVGQSLKVPVSAGAESSVAQVVEPVQEKRPTRTAQAPRAAESAKSADPRKGERVIHKVRSGETLGQVAARYGTTIRAIQVWNHLRDADQVMAGQPLVLYPSVKEASPANRAPDLAGTPRPNAPVVAGDEDAPAADVYRVKRGDTLWSIAQAHGMSVSAVQSLNPEIKRASSLKAGAKIFVKSRGRDESLVMHRVVKGETLQEIATRYGTTVGQIRKWNRMGRNESTIRPGDRLKLYR